MTYPPNGPRHGEPEPEPGYAHPGTETQSIPRVTLAEQGAPPSAVASLPQGPPPGPPQGPQQAYAAPPPGLPQGYAGPPPGYPPAGHAPPRPRMPRVIIAIWMLAAISVAGVALGLSLKEHNVNAWKSVHAWGAMAILGAVLTAAPAFGSSAHVSALRCWQVAVAGAATLAFFWILFVLPNVGSNTTLLTTVGVVAGIAASWIAPGQLAADKSDVPTW
jgi:hypothetical protein